MLGPHDFRLVVDGTSTLVEAFQSVRGSQRFVLILDRSASMKEFSGSVAEHGLVGGEIMLAAMPENSKVALITFADTVTAYPFEDREVADRTIVSLKGTKPEGHASVFDSLERALQLFDKPHIGDTIVIVSDGADSALPIHARSLSDQFVARGIRIFALLYFVRGIPAREDSFGPESMSNFTKVTGGNTWVTADHGDKPDKSPSLMVQQFSERLQPPYELSFNLTQPNAKNAKLKISTTAHGLELEYPQILPACETAAVAVAP